MCVGKAETMVRRLIATLALVAGLIGAAQTAHADSLCGRVTVAGEATASCVPLP